VPEQEIEVTIMRKKSIILCMIILFLTMLTATNITEAEYYIDYIPGAIPLLVLITADSLVSFQFNADLSSVSPGMHSIHFRVKDSNGVWSHFSRKTFFKSEEVSSQLVRLEYCFDSDPANTQSISLSSMGNEGCWFLESELYFPPLTPPGMHLLSITVIDDNGCPGFKSNRIVMYQPSNTNYLTRFSWYFTGNEADPAQIFNQTAAGQLTELSEELSLALPSLTAGLEYKLHFYAVRDDGSKSMETVVTFTYQFTIDNITITVNGNSLVLSWDQVPNISYYLVERKNNPNQDGTWEQTTTNALSITPVDNKEFYRVKAVRN
jgi:hypothetical protein